MLIAGYKLIARILVFFYYIIGRLIALFIIYKVVFLGWV
jgi:hypothetical protein